MLQSGHVLLASLGNHPTIIIIAGCTLGSSFEAAPISVWCIMANRWLLQLAATSNRTLDSTSEPPISFWCFRSSEALDAGLRTTALRDLRLRPSTLSVLFLPPVSQILQGAYTPRPPLNHGVLFCVRP